VDKAPKPELEIHLFEKSEDWAAWLETHHAASVGVWLRCAKKASALSSIDYAQALEVALCYGWIDSQKRTYDSDSWLQKYTPRGPRSIWSKVNRDKVDALIKSVAMKPAGLREVERAKADGRWDAAYDPASTAEIPADLQAELDRNPTAKAFFETLNRQNRYAILFRLQTAKKAETRAKRLQQFIAQLERHESIYPQTFPRNDR
jgi:uncharacterized protein YdeI (YjbR/CyaY-like superfamily)